LLKADESLVRCIGRLVSRQEKRIFVL
jgi:hypothetical protein